jgi:hypoxanthine phosphoribosyltransferase
VSGASPVPPARPLRSAGELRRRVRQLGEAIAAAHPDGVLLVAVLKGSLPFLADLVRVVPAPVEIDFLAISSYEPGSGRVRLVKDLDADVAGRPVILVEDIVDTGLTLAYLLGELRRRQPASLEVCALLDKTARRILPTEIRYRGFEVPDLFVLGYGLDFAGRYRNLDRLVGGDLAVLTADPDAYVDQLYGSGPSPSRRPGGRADTR